MTTDLALRASLLASLVTGGAASGAWCARSCQSLNPQQAVIFGACNGAMMFLFREFTSWQADWFNLAPCYWQAAFIMPAATLATATLADTWGMPLMPSTACTIGLGSTIIPIVGALVLCAVDYACRPPVKRPVKEFVTPLY